MKQPANEPCPPAPCTDTAQAAVLARYDILDTEREAAFDDIAQLAADIFGAPIAVVNFVTGQRQWFKAEIGIGQRELPLDVSICRHALLQPGIFVVPDLALDGRFAANPLVATNGGLRFYAGALLEADGVPLGTICVLDTAPRPGGITQSQARALSTLASQVMALLEIRRSQAALRASEARLGFLDRLAAATQPLTDAADVMAATARLLGEHLGVSVCAYADMDADEDGFTIRGDWAAPGSTSIVGHYRLADFGRLAVSRLSAGLPLVIDDNARELPPEEAATFQNIGIAATICMPLVKEGRLTALMAIHDRAPRAWTGAELALLREVTARSWAHVERVGAVAGLRASELRLRAVFDQAAVGLAQTDPRGRFVQVNERYCAIVGRPREELLAMRMQDLTHPDDLQANLACFTATVEGGPAFEIEERCLRPDGSAVWVRNSVNAIRSAAGAVEGTLAVTLDLTRKRLAEARERESEMRLRLALEGAKLGTWDWDLRTSRGTWSPRTVAILGVEDGHDVTPERRNETIHPDDRDRVWREVAEALRHGTELASEYRVVRPDGGTRWIASRGAIERDAAGAPIRAAGIILDMTERALAEASVRESEARFRAMADASPALIWVNDAQGASDFVNAEYLRFFGKAREELAGFGWTPSAHPDDRDAYVATYLAAVDARAPFQAQARFADASGEYRWLESTAAPRFGPDGAYLGHIGLSLDITERKVAEVALAGSEAVLRSVVDAAPIGLVVADPSGRIVSGNARLAEILERPLARSEGVERYGEDYVAFHAGGRRVRSEEYPLARVVRGDAERAELEVQAQLPDGSLRWVRHIATQVRDDNGRILGGVVASLDIDRDKRFAEELAREVKAAVARVDERTAELERTWRLSQDLLVINDTEGRLIAVNEAWTKVLGWSEQELLRKRFTDLAHPDDIEPTLERFRRVLQAPLTEPYEYRLRHKEGDYRWIAWTAAFHDNRVFASGRDVTERRARQAELEAAQDALRQSQKMEAMGQLTGGVAHDFNNLLTPIVGSLDLLQRRGMGGEREQRLIDGALQSAERARLLVQRLLAFARRQPLQPKPVDIGALVAGMADLVASTTGPQIKVVVDVADGLPAAVADPNQVEMAILNLCVNARDAMETGGTLRISAEGVDVGAGHPARLRAGRYVRLSVADTGAGMDEATLKRAVEPFFSTKGIGRGTGLGLSMVHGLASQLGGTLAIHSQKGLGTNIDILLPASAAGAAGRTWPDAPAALPASTGTALVVDDEELVRASTADMLADLGYTVVEAASAEEALRVLDAGVEPDLLVTDHLMPGMTGAELARAARERLPGARVLVVSGYADVAGLAPDLVRLTKPFRQADLAAKLGEFDDRPAGAAPGLAAAAGGRDARRDD